MFVIVAAAMAAVVAVVLAAFAHSMDSHCDFHDAIDVHHRLPIAVNYTRLANTDFLVDHANSAKRKEIFILDSVLVQQYLIRPAIKLTSKMCLYKSWNFFMMRFFSANAFS